MRYSEAGRTLIYEKNLILKISCQTPFNLSFFDPEYTYIKPTMILKIILKAAYNMFILEDFSCIQWGIGTGENLPMTEKEILKMFSESKFRIRI